MTETMVICKEDVDNDVVQLTNAASTPSPSISPTGSSKNKRPRLTFPFGACRVCTDSATGVHYGIATCEGCKGFFKRSILRKEKYRCYFDNACLINVTNRNRCKACRFRRCINEGMSVDGVKMGRIPKLVKERALRELKEKQMRQEASLIEVNERADEVHARESSCSSLSDQSTENCDPDIMELGTSHYPISSARRPYGSAKLFTDNSSTMNPHALLVNHQRFNRSANLSQFDINSSSHVSQHASHSLIYRTNYPSFLPEDFHLDESVGLSEHSTGPLSHDVFKHVITVSDKLSQNKNLVVHLDEDESTFIRFLRWSSYSVYVRYSKRVKQLETRMEYMVREGIRDFPGDNASSEEFFGAVRDTLTALVRSTVFHTQELPGMTNMDSSVLQKLILHRSFDWFMLKYARLLHKNGQFYFVAPNGFQCTRRWMNIFYGVDMTNAMFEFSQCFHELNLDESELALIIPLQMLHPDPTIADEEIPRMLRACYLYALYEELCLNRGEAQGRLLCSKVLQMLDRLVPLNYLYGKNVGSRVLQE